MLAGRERRVKVLDFGLAKLREEAASDGETTTAALSGEGRILGTGAYMSPEQAEGKPADARSDLFSLGIVLYELATGERPFKGDTSTSVLSAILRDTPKSVTDLRADLPRELGRIVRRCLQKDVEDRYQSAKDIRSDLRTLRAEVDSGDFERERAGSVRGSGSERGVGSDAARVCRSSLPMERRSCLRRGED
jgi:serine/threonine protein kinase